MTTALHLPLHHSYSIYNIARFNQYDWRRKDANQLDTHNQLPLLGHNSLTVWIYLCMLLQICTKEGSLQFYY
jgi:hypothetical protein